MRSSVNLSQSGGVGVPNTGHVQFQNETETRGEDSQQVPRVADKGGGGGRGREGGRGRGYFT